MVEPLGKLSVREKQRELRDRCRHPTGKWRPVDWQSPQQSIPDRIAAIARSRPDQLAVCDPQTSLTYGQLDRAANQIANAILAERGPGQEVVALLVGVDVPAVTAALGVLKAGKIYVALEASFPQQRSLYILADTDARLILSDERHLAQARELAGSERRVIRLEGLDGGDARAPDVRIPLDTLAILNYTSGSTGQPKGVVQSHFSAYVLSVRRYSFFHTSDADRVAFSGSLAGADTIRSVFGPLCLGASIEPLDMRRYTTHQLVQWLVESEPTMFGGRQLMGQIVDHDPEQQFPSVRAALIGGYTVFREDVEAYMRAFPNALIDVGLGLSEAGRVTEMLFDSPEMLAWDVVPLGLPVPGLQIRLLSDDDREVEPGEAGEIVVLGPGLAAGYWQRPELTAAKFRAVEALGPEPAYFTGDLGRQTPDGLFHHIGRKDHMVKIRGYQLFTDEIESILCEVEGVKEACVLAHNLPEGDQRLAAYLVVDDQDFPGVAAFHSRFEELPRHMAPQSYVFLDALPKAPSGKVDRSRLPVPRRSRLGVTAEYVAARDPIEKILTILWGNVLEVDGLGVHDNFHELGGDSLDSTRIISLVVAVLGVELTMREFFDVPTIAEMAGIIRAVR